MAIEETKMSSAASAIVAIQNKYLKRFEQAGATSPETAVDLAEIGCRETHMFHRMIERNIFKTNAQGKYYLDLEAAEEFRRGRRARALVALLLVLVLTVLALSLTVLR
jgi:hypothetical protein